MAGARARYGDRRVAWTHSRDPRKCFMSLSAHTHASERPHTNTRTHTHRHTHKHTHTASTPYSGRHVDSSAHTHAGKLCVCVYGASTWPSRLSATYTQRGVHAAHARTRARARTHTHTHTHIYTHARPVCGGRPKKRKEENKRAADGGLFVGVCVFMCVTHTHTHTGGAVGVDEHGDVVASPYRGVRGPILPLPCSSPGSVPVSGPGSCLERRGSARSCWQVARGPEHERASEFPGEPLCVCVCAYVCVCV